MTDEQVRRMLNGLRTENQASKLVVAALNQQGIDIVGLDARSAPAAPDPAEAFRFDFKASLITLICRSILCGHDRAHGHLCGQRTPGQGLTLIGRKVGEPDLLALDHAIEMAACARNHPPDFEGAFVSVHRLLHATAASP
jgi:hypothetical protein